MKMNLESKHRTGCPWRGCFERLVHTARFWKNSHMNSHDPWLSLAEDRGSRPRAIHSTTAISTGPPVTQHLLLDH